MFRIGVRVVGLCKPSHSLASSCITALKRRTIVATTHQEVINFWFNESSSLQEKQKLWFGGSPDDDKIIKYNFTELVLKARDGQLAHWEDLSEGASGGLAFIILLDQFCRSIFRGREQCFDCDHKALNVSLQMIESGLDKKLTHIQRIFAYLPIEHCESLAMQEKSVELYRELFGEMDIVAVEERGLITVALRFAEEHHAIIEQFGRFPSRNKALNRVNTPEEEEILNSWPYKW